MSNLDIIEQALALIEQEQPPPDRPALVVMPPDSKSFLIGNRGGFLKLAAAALKAARGEKQVFTKEPWFVMEDYDWDVAGLTPDEDAHIYLPKTLTRRGTFIQNAWGYVLPVVCVIPFAVGFITIINWLMHLLHIK